MIRFESTKAERQLINKIVERAEDFDLLAIDRETLRMDIDAVHSNGCRLYLQMLYEAEGWAFAYDITGIQRHIDRRSESPSGGRLLDEFEPIFAQATTGAKPRNNLPYSMYRGKTRDT